MSIISVRNLQKTFKHRKEVVNAVKNISFDVKKGEIFGLLGPNGAGKTTTINMLTGLTSHDSGIIKIFNKDPKKDWEYVKNNSNVSTAYYPLSEALTVYQNLMVFAKIYNIKNPKEKIKHILHQFELDKLANRRVSKLSSGEMTRTALCKGLINDPKVLFLDECTVGLDPDIAQKTREILKNFQKKFNATILFTSHYMAEVEQLCDRIAFMSDGEIFRIDTADNLKEMIELHEIHIIVKENKEKLIEILNEKNITLKIDNDNIRFNISKSDDAVYKILNRLFTQGVKISHLDIKRPTLDDIFIKIARKK